LDAEPKAYTITATSTEDETKSNTATITVTAAPVIPVTPAVTSVTVAPSSAEVTQGTQRQLTADVEVVGGAVQTVNWSSDDTTNKVTVDENGLVSVALDAEPKAYVITATSTVDETKSNTATITVTAAPVTPAVTSVTVAPSSAEVTQGTQRQLTADVVVVGGAAQTVNWSSDDTTNKVTVDQNGLVSVALDAEPKAYVITATSTVDETKSNTATITVKPILAEPTYSIGTITDQTGRILIAGYRSGTQETKTITVLNTGTGILTNLKVELTTGSLSAFQLSPVIEMLHSGDRGSFTIRATDGLAAGTYTGTITLSADQLSTSFNFTQQVVSPSVPNIPSTPVTTTPPISTPVSTIPSSSTPSVETDVEVLVNGKVEKAGKLVNSITNNQVVSTVIVDPDKLNEKLTLEGDHAIVIIPVMTGADVIIGELNGQMIKNMEQKQAVLKIQTETATYTLPAQEINIDHIFEQIGQRVSLADVHIQIKIATPDSKMRQVVEKAGEDTGFNVVIPPLDFSIQGSYENTKVDINRFNVYVERSVALPEGLDPNKITTGVVIDPQGNVRHVPTKVLKTDEKYSAVINSLTNSTYAIIWNPIEFDDMNHHWAEQAVNDMGSRMIVEGYENGLYAPDNVITRAEFATIIVRALGLRVDHNVSVFADVDSTAWYAGAVQTAYDYKLINGYEDGTFRPTDQITREQAILVIAKAMNLTKLNTIMSKSESDEILGQFIDVDTVSSSSKESIAVTLRAGIVNGKGIGFIAPKDSLTRAEVAALMQRLLQKSELI
ncbi:S-layer homology domain-containing protein, partial [Paenibacillus sp. MER 99-2]|uniref:S-layer homology domain-containing protein n=1 Tax=Paenibacillus sp. MER 99-2 TaxID=2939572 RepID=UPI00203EB496